MVLGCLIHKRLATARPVTDDFNRGCMTKYGTFVDGNSRGS